MHILLQKTPQIGLLKMVNENLTNKHYEMQETPKNGFLKMVNEHLTN